MKMDEMTDELIVIGDHQSEWTFLMNRGKFFWQSKKKLKESTRQMNKFCCCQN
jgi:hypothetical protein